MTDFDKRLDKLETAMVPPVLPTVSITLAASDGQPGRVVVLDLTGFDDVPPVDPSPTLADLGTGGAW